MGTFRIPLEVGDSAGQRWQSVEALVDTGSSYSILPSTLLEGLGVTPHDERVFALADGRRIRRRLGRTWVRLDGKSEITLVAFGTESDVPVVGAYTLEGFGLVVDPVGQRLAPTDALYLASDSGGCA